MLIAVVATLCDREVLDYQTIIIGIVLGSLIGAVMATKVQMTAMPQLVALFNGLGGGASVLVAFASLATETESLITNVAIVCSGLIGAVTFWGSLIAFGKLQELNFLRKPVRFSGQQVVNLLLAAATLLPRRPVAMATPMTIWIPTIGSRATTTPILIPRAMTSG